MVVGKGVKTKLQEPFLDLQALHKFSVFFFFGGEARNIPGPSGLKVEMVGNGSTIFFGPRRSGFIPFL